jgi:hypothetical protein
MSSAKYLAVSLGMLCFVSSSLIIAFGQTSYSKEALVSEKDGTVHVVANDSRPLLQTIDALQIKYGWRINYEDPQYASKLDVVDAKGLQDKATYPNGEHRVPGGGTFTADFPVKTAPIASVEERKILQSIIESYNRSNNPGRFELREDSSGEIFDLVGVSAHDNQGKVSAQQVLLDQSLTIAAQERTFSDTMDLMCDSLTEKTHVKVSLGVHPMGLDRTKVTVGGKDLAARAYLSRAIESTNRRLEWRLLYDPDSSGYFLNVHQVKLP